MHNFKLKFFDIETTGLNPMVDEIIQFSAIIEINDEIIEEVDFKARPNNAKLIQPEVTKLLGTTVEEIMSRPLSQVELYESILAFYDKHVDKYDRNDKFIVVGYNIDFDKSFMRQFFLNHGNRYIDSYINHHSIDVMAFAHIFLIYCMIPPAQENLKLTTMCRYAKIPLDKAHDSLYDTHAMRRLLKWFEERMSIDYEFES